MGLAIFSVIKLANTPSKTAPTRLAFADGLRGLAALWVVLFHLSEGRHIDSLKAVLPAWLNLALFDAGDLGVAMFFALSGFVMALTLPNGLNNHTQATHFMARRLTRLTPPYYLAIALTLILGWVKLRATGGGWVWPGWESVLANMAYLQGLLSIPDINSVFWTLCIELQFYLAFALLLWVIAKLTQGRPMSLKGQILMHLAAWTSLAWPIGWLSEIGANGLFLPLWYAFMAGLMAFHGWKQTGWERVSAAMFLLFVMLLAWTQQSPFMAAVGLTGVALMLVGMSGAMSRGLSWAPLQSLALCSYSLYLLHNPITGAVANILRRLTISGVWADLAVGLCCVVACVFVARLAYLWVEVPSMNWSRRWAVSSKFL